MSLEERRKGFQLGMAYSADAFTLAAQRSEWTADERAVIGRFFEAAAEDVEKVEMPSEVADEPARAAPAYGGPPPPPEEQGYNRGVREMLDALRMEAEAVRHVEHPLRMKAIDAYRARVEERAAALRETNPFRGRR